MTLEQLSYRIKGSKLIKLEKTGTERLYLRFGANNQYMSTTAYLTVVNDRIDAVVKVENRKAQQLHDPERATRYKQDIVEQFHELIYDCELERKKVPLHERLRDSITPVYENSLLHQAQALRFLCSMKVSALFADTGTGKSKIILDLINSRYEATQIRKALIFCPVATKKNFDDEIKKWHPKTKVEFKIVGIESMGSSDRIFLEALNWVCDETQIVIDESHFCKNPFAKRSLRIQKCCDKTSYKAILTGTPFEHPKDIYQQFALLSPLITGCSNYIKFEQKYLIMGGPAMDEVIGYKNLDHLLGLIEPYTYQVRKEDVLNLPAKQFHERYCGLNARQEELYNIEKENLLKEIENENIDAHTIFRYFTLLQQISCGFYKPSRDAEVEDIGSNKLELLTATGISEGQTLFFCKYLFETEKLIAYLGKENCAVFTGQNTKTRDDEKNLFATGEKRYFVATMGSGGVGLNGLQVCSRIVFYSNSFAWMQRKQCIGRIDRQGQVNGMNIYDLITNSGIDYRIQANLSRKGNLADEIRSLLIDKTKLKQYVEKL